MVANSGKLSKLKEEANNITSFNLIGNATTFLEKIVWASIFIWGSWFIYDVVTTQLTFWHENPILTTTTTKALKEIKPPAVTFCHKALEKYGPFERLTNYFDPKKRVPKEISKILLTVAKNDFSKLSKMYQWTENQMKGKSRKVLFSLKSFCRSTL